MFLHCVDCTKLVYFDDGPREPVCSDCQEKREAEREEVLLKRKGMSGSGTVARTSS